MAEESKVRLVRCPKCENILPEVPGFSVYQCGGCGAALREKKEPRSDEGVEKCDEGREGSESSRLYLGGASENERESDRLGHGVRKEGKLYERVISSDICSTSRADNKEVLVDTERTQRGEKMSLKFGQEGKVGCFVDEYGETSNSLIYDCIHRNGQLHRPKFVDSSVGNEPRKIRSPIASLKSRQMRSEWGVRGDRSLGHCGNTRGVREQGSFATFPFSDEGPSNCYRGYLDGCVEQTRKCHQLNGPSRVEKLENDRAELLGKLKELQDQLSRSSGVAEKPKGGVSSDSKVASAPSYNVHNAYMHEGLTSSWGVHMQPLARDRPGSRPFYFNADCGSIPYCSRLGPDVQDFYSSPWNIVNESLGYEDAYHKTTRRGPLHQPPPHILQRSYLGHLPRKYFNVHPAPMASFQYEAFFDQPACCCSHCHNQNWQIPSNFSTAGLTSQASRNDFTSSISYPHINPAASGSHVHNPQGSDLCQLDRRQQQHQTSSSDRDIDIEAPCHHRPRRATVSNGITRVSYPMAGGAPFVTCWNCFELLKLPRKRMGTRKISSELRCGACSSMIFFKFIDQRLVLSIPVPVNVQVGDDSGEMLIENLKISNSSDGCLYADGENPSLDDFDLSKYNCQLKATETRSLSGEQQLNFNESEKMQGPCYSSSSLSEDDQSPEPANKQRDVSNSSVLPLKEEKSLPLPQSPVRDYSSNDMGNRYREDRNKGKRADREKVILDRTTSQQDAVTDAPLAEMEVFYHDFSNTGLSHDYEEVSKEAHLKRNNGGESSFVGRVKKGFRDFTGSNQNVENKRSSVFVNGQLIPNRVVKKAERLAGPIQPGKYWYDYQAGFWGVIGHPCLGIIPPFIEEFNYPMPKNCASGNTRVFVNGRELHQNDLDLLAGRGLPITKNKFYHVDISGAVLDEQTGEELERLGKLALTVERMGRGFGVKVPEEFA